MTNSIYILLVLLCSNLCASDNKKLEENDDTKFVIKELEVINNSHLEQIKSIISATDCFEKHKQERNIICLIYESSDFIFVPMENYIGYRDSDLKREYGGFYEKIDDLSFLFVVAKTDYIPSEMYKITGETINVEKYMIFNFLYDAPDAVWYLKNENDKLKLFAINCW